MSTPESPAAPVDQTPNKSCELCKARKVRCDRKLPSCTWCVRNDRRCVYTERKRPGVPTSLGIQMEEKMEALESNLQMLADRIESYASDSGETIPSSFSGRKSRRGNIIRSYSSIETQRPRPSLDPSSNFASSLITFDPSLDLPFNDPEGIKLAQHQLPSMATLQELVKCFLRDVSSWAPLISQRSTESLLTSELSISTDDAILLHGIIAVSIRFCPQSILHVTETAQYYHRSRKIVLEHALQHTSVRSTQALTLVAIDALGSKDDCEGRKIIAMLHQCLMPLGLVVEPLVFFTMPNTSNQHDDRFLPRSRSQPDGWTEEEERKRLAWTIYMLDRYATVGTANQFSIPELNIMFPRHHSNSDHALTTGLQWYGRLVSETELMDYENGTFSHHCELLVIMSQMQEFCRTPLDPDSAIAVHVWRSKYRMLDAMLNRWLTSLPRAISITHQEEDSRTLPDPGRINLQSTHILAVIRLCSPAAYPLQETEHFRHLINARHRCLEAVDSLRGLSLEISPMRSLQALGPHFAFVHFVCASLLLVHAGATGTSVDRTVWFFISALETLGQRWSVAEHYANALRSVLHHVEKGMVKTSPNFSDYTGLNLASLRRRAHEILLLSSKTRDSVHDGASSHSLSEHDLAAITVFGFFQFPVLNAAQHETNEPAPAAMSLGTLETSPWDVGSSSMDPFAEGTTPIGYAIPQSYDWDDPNARQINYLE